ncbi:phage holin family protein [Hyalangium versicolor]|uniref:phage holin family protein n=1 Tax=Hyalangium versicolor TaxID=2861190 RepID=UPI001CCDF291|nr:phage holin family protein [Hyalangium versicolor]
MNLGTEQTDRGIAALVGRMADSFSRLVSQHITLARLELAEDAKAMGLDVARIVAFVPFLLVGYLFLCGALSVVLATWMGYAGGLAVVGGINVVGGGLGIWLAVSRMQGRQVMDDSSQELSRSMAVLTTVNAPAVPPQPRNVLKEPPNAQ